MSPFQKYVRITFIRNNSLAVVKIAFFVCVSLPFPFIRSIRIEFYFFRIHDAYTVRKWQRQRRHWTEVRTQLRKRLRIRLNGYVMLETRHKPGCVHAVTFLAVDLSSEKKDPAKGFWRRCCRCCPSRGTKFATFQTVSASCASWPLCRWPATTQWRSCRRPWATSCSFDGWRWGRPESGRCRAQSAIFVDVRWSTWVAMTTLCRRPLTSNTWPTELL